ncbi:MAG TPA: hypothetical protein VN715_12515 [Roseiarcus sp.]|nr:hypothetical protein [Roseiarcus sp.]
MTPELFFLLGVFHAAVGILTTTINLFVGHRRTASTAARDMSGLRVALAAELGQLRHLYKANIDALYAGQDALVSCRMFSVIYRANLGRLHLLSAADIAPIVAAYAMSERVEAMVAVHCKAHGANAFSMGKERPFAEALIAAYEKGAAAVERGLRALGQGEEDGAEAAESRAGEPVARLRAA